MPGTSRGLVFVCVFGFVTAAVALGCGDGDPVSDDAGGGDAGADAMPPDDAAVDAAVTAPVVTITSHTEGQRVTGSRTITVVGTLTADDTIAAVAVTVGAGAAITATYDQTSFSASVALGDQDNVVTVTATDAAARSGGAQVTVVYPFVALTSFQAASQVLGQPNFITGTQRATVDAARIASPYGDPVEVGGVVYVSDFNGDRVLGFRGFPAADNQAADFVLGQPALTATGGGVGAGRLDGPETVLAHAGRLYVNDYENSRILIWSSPPTTTGAPADAVIGQADLTSRAAACTATGMDSPEDVAIAGGRLIVADASNNRVLIWNSVPAGAGVAPDLVLGQADYTHCTPDDDNQDQVADATPSARTMDYPAGLWSDGTRLVVADGDNRRILIWNQFPTSSFEPADVVLGQPDASSSAAGTAADRFGFPYYVESNGNQLFVADHDNHRVSIWNGFPTAATPADIVLGQSDFAHVTGNDDDQNGVVDTTPSARTLRSPSGVRLIRDRLFVVDHTNNRVLIFGPPVCTVNAGQFEFPAGSGTCIDDPCAPSPCSNYRTCDRQSGAAVCTCPPGVTGDCDTCVRYVDAAATGTATGYSWIDAAPRVQPAADSAATAGVACEVWVKEGTYYTYVTAATNTVSVRGTVTLRGGFAGTETTATGRSGGATILDGRDSAAALFQVHHVVSSTTGTTAGTPTLDRLTIRGGYAAGTGNAASGGGLFINSTARVAVVDCVFEANRAASLGGGLFSSATAAAAMTIDRTTFTANSAGLSGGGAMLSGGTITDSNFAGNTVGTTFGHTGGAVTLAGTGTITRTRFTGNQAGGDGGAIRFNGAAAAWTVADSDIVGNRGVNGGGIYFDAAGSGCILRSTLIAGNVASGSGGGMTIRDSSPTLANLTVVGNVAATASGGIHPDGTNATITNVIARGNRAPSSPEIRNSLAGTMSYSNIGGGFAGTGNIDVAPGFVHAPLTWDRVVAAGATTDTVTVSAGSAFAVGDHIEIGDDGVARQITAVTGNDLTFAPALTASAVNVTVQNWGTENVDLDADFHLAAGSACVDAGDGDRAPVLDHDGEPRVDDPATTDTGVGTPTYTDLGCHER